MTRLCTQSNLSHWKVKGLFRCFIPLFRPGMRVKVNKDVQWMVVLDTDKQPHVTSPASLYGETLHAGVKLALMPLCSLFLIVALF